VVNFVINTSDSALESNLFTKNVKANVTEDQLLKALSLIVSVTSVQQLQEKHVNINNVPIREHSRPKNSVSTSTQVRMVRN
jgi:hypothetical protein